MIHPRANGVTSASGEAALRQRNQHIKSINEYSVLAWIRASGYYRQSEVENICLTLGLSLVAHSSYTYASQPETSTLITLSTQG